MAEKIWKSPRKVDEEVREYKRRRFESYMQMVDDGVFDRALGIAALRQELDNIIWTPEGKVDHERIRTIGK